MARAGIAPGPLARKARVAIARWKPHKPPAAPLSSWKPSRARLRTSSVIGPVTPPAPAELHAASLKRCQFVPITPGMAEEQHQAEQAPGHHFACTLSSVLVRRIRRILGEEGLTELLDRAG